MKQWNDLGMGLQKEMSFFKTMVSHPMLDNVAKDGLSTSTIEPCGMMVRCW